MPLLMFALLLSASVLTAGRLRTLGVAGPYFINWNGAMTNCEGAENKIFNMEKLVVQKKSKSLMAMVGNVTLTRKTTTKIKFVITIFKEINGNYEYTMKVQEENLCKHISEQNKPWTPFVNEMGISGCPIPEKIYTFKNSSLDTAGFPLSAAQAGNYRAKVELFEDGKRTVCMIVYAKVEQI